MFGGIGCDRYNEIEFRNKGSDSRVSRAESIAIGLEIEGRDMGDPSPSGDSISSSS